MKRRLQDFLPTAARKAVLGGLMLGLFGAALLAQTAPPAKVRPSPRPGSVPPAGVAQTAPLPAPQATPTVPAGPKPVVQVVGDERFDFGAFWPDSTPSLQHSFTLKNTGDAELQILRVQPG